MCAGSPVGKEETKAAGLTVRSRRPVFPLAAMKWGRDGERWSLIIAHFPSFPILSSRYEFAFPTRLLILGG